MMNDYPTFHIFRSLFYLVISDSLATGFIESNKFSIDRFLEGQISAQIKREHNAVCCEASLSHQWNRTMGQWRKEKRV